MFSTHCQKHERFSLDDIENEFSSTVLSWCYNLDMGKSLIRKADYLQRVSRVLAEQNFIIGDKERKIIKDRISNGRRYFFMVGKRKEGNALVERFIKIPENSTKKLLVPFQRQIEVARYIKSKRIITTRGVISANYDLKRGAPFVIMETFPTGHSEIGFIEGIAVLNFSVHAKPRVPLISLKNFMLFRFSRCPRS